MRFNAYTMLCQLPSLRARVAQQAFCSEARNGIEHERIAILKYSHPSGIVDPLNAGFVILFVCLFVFG